MKALLVSIALGFGLVAASAAQAQAPAAAPAGSTGLCKDGTYYSGETKKGACRGHKGVKDWYAGAAAAPAANDAAAAPAEKKTKKPNKDSAAAAPAAAPAASAAPKPADATGLCKDGTYYTGETKKGACRGHKGVKDWYAGAAAAPAANDAAAAPADKKPKKDSAAAAPAASSAAKPADATGMCKDGTYYTGETKKGACRGHKGVKDWYGAAAAAPAKTTPPMPATSAAAAPAAPAPKMTPAPTPAAAATPASKMPAAPTTHTPVVMPTVPAAGGGHGKVWVNSETKVYHCEGDRYYGRTKQGEYMSEADAVAKGVRPSHGNACEK
ncbi:MAG: DUF3761 domain-containing protein [Dokdonella sp.]